MRKKELIAQFEETLRRVEVEAELRESAFMRSLKDEQDGWAALGSQTKRNRTWEDVKSNLEECFRAWSVNPLAKSYVDYQRYFVIGKGTQVAPGEGEGDDAGERIQAFLDLNEWSLLEKQLCEELARDGEVFVRFHDKNIHEIKSTVSRITLVDPLEIEAIDCEELNEPKRYRRVYTALGEMDDNGSQKTESKAEWIDASDIIHIKVNTSHNELRGRSDILVMLPSLKILRSWVKDMARRNYLLGSFVWDVECTGGVKPSSVTGAYPTAPLPGSIIAHGPNEKWSAITPRPGNYEAVAGQRALKLEFCAGAKLPESWFGDTGESNLATTKALSMPSLKAFIDRQDVLVYYFQKIISRGANVETVEVTFPEVVVEEAAAKAQALLNLAQAIAILSEQGLLGRESAYELVRQQVESLDAWSDDESGMGEKQRIEMEDQADTQAIAQGSKPGVVPRPSLEGELAAGPGLPA